MTRDIPPALSSLTPELKRDFIKSIRDYDKDKDKDKFYSTYIKIKDTLEPLLLEDRIELINNTSVPRRVSGTTPYPNVVVFAIRNQFPEDFFVMLREVGIFDINAAIDTKKHPIPRHWSKSGKNKPLDLAKNKNDHFKKISCLVEAALLIEGDENVDKKMSIMAAMLAEDDEIETLIVDSYNERNPEDLAIRVEEGKIVIEEEIFTERELGIMSDVISSGRGKTHLIEKDADEVETSESGSNIEPSSTPSNVGGSRAADAEQHQSDDEGISNIRKTIIGGSSGIDGGGNSR